MPELLGTYKNGNTIVKIYTDGTKIRQTKDDEFKVDFPESFDCKITNYCDANCSYCHEMSNTSGQHGDLNIHLFDSLHPFTEIAIGGGNPLSHPDLIPFLTKLKDKLVVANMTVNQKHVVQYQDMIRSLIDEKLIHGLGISLTNSQNLQEKEIIESFGDNVVIHVIHGIFSEKDLEFVKNKKMLILGYKTFGRGIVYRDGYHSTIQNRMQWLQDNLMEITSNNIVCSFDNLAIEQLNLKNIVSKEVWDKHFQGDDGSHTMYYDAVKQMAAVSSTTPEDKRIHNDKNYSLLEMFKLIQQG